MDSIQVIFNSREIAIGIWLIIAVISLSFMKPMRDAMKTIIPILFSKKFVVFYLVFFTFLSIVIYFLEKTKFWDMGLLKDTIFWVIFVQFPLFAKAIEKAKDGRFFRKIIKENITFIVIIEFFLGFWTFNLWLEVALVPVTVLISAIYAFIEHKKQHKRTKHFVNGLFAIWSIIVVVYSIYNTIRFPEQIFNLDTVKSFLIPLVLLLLNLPVVYGLALYCGYEELYIRLKGSKLEKLKMKILLIWFSGIKLSKVTAVRKKISETIMVSTTAAELKKNLTKLEKHLSLQIGENYMRRSRFYIAMCILAFVVSLIGLIWANSNITFNDILAWNITIDFVIIKQIATYIFSAMIGCGIFALIYAIGFGKKKYEEISQIKKFVLFELLSAARRQESQLQEFLPLEEPEVLYASYVVYAYEIETACSKVLDGYDNILKVWEREDIEYLKMYAMAVVNDIDIPREEFEKYNIDTFVKHYNDKVASAPQSKDFNNFTYLLKTDLEKYVGKIKIICEEFKNY